jgi:hypothetical protein
MTSRYEKIVSDFNEKGCQLLDTYEQYIETITSAKKSTYKLNYIASCGHKHIVYYNVFKGRGTGIICPSCKNKEIGNNKKQQIKNNEMSKTAYMDQEHTFILKIIDLLKDEFDIVKAFDGCHIDLIFKPKHIENEWVGIQIKTSHTIHLTYSFHLHTNYKDCLLLFYCCEDGSMWLVPENTIINQKKVSIGYNKSKYNIYKTTNDDIKLKLNEFYEKTLQANLLRHLKLACYV